MRKVPDRTEFALVDLSFDDIYLTGRVFLFQSFFSLLENIAAELGIHRRDGVGNGTMVLRVIGA